MKTAKGICLNLNESDYFFNYKGIIFYFSSEFYKKKFVDNIQNYIENETYKLQVKYNINLNIDVMLMISLYKKIEKRGFRIYDARNNKEITSSCGLVADIIMY